MMKRTKEINELKDLKSIILDHLSRSQYRNMPMDQRFEALWKALNVYGTFFSKEIHDNKMLEWTLQNSEFSNLFNSIYNKDPHFRKSLVNLKDLTPIYDMRPGRNKAVIINDVSNPAQVLDAIYQVRCNLIHGQKSRGNPRDRKLIRLSYLILSRIVSVIITNLK